ncbi:hypothetical protein [Methylacidiphilum kamchatkense]|uniref:Uncharacterized protein n=1 Tax=Methylacidiphilum kamchatkense Kam1 TaxID=1202785 RepID=A0A516TMC9_9BACT|nr:hypothetical protein [Methylacidiphilum kamchatkense]QDQ42400.1 hypothetical protein kam1_1172 [Methylacidiphilum kamchatkense Kam1]
MNVFASFSSSNRFFYDTEKVIQEILWENTIDTLPRLLPPIPANLLTFDQFPNNKAIESIPVEGGWLNLLVHPIQWPKDLLQVYYEDLVILFSCVKSKEVQQNNLQPIALCQFVQICKKKKMALENKNCPFNCMGICAIGTFQNQSLPVESLNHDSIGYYLGLTKQQVQSKLKIATEYLKNAFKQKKAFCELLSNS